MQRDTEALGRPQQPALYTTFVEKQPVCLVKCTAAEELQIRVQQEKEKIAQLQEAMAAGDKSHKAELDVETAALKKLQDQVIAKEKEARERQRNQFVPPAF